MSISSNNVPSGGRGGADKLHAAMAMEELVRANADSNKTMVTLVEHLKAETEARDRKIDIVAKNTKSMQRLAMALIGAVAILLVIAAINASNIAVARKNAATTAAIAKDSRSTNTTLLDCLNSTGACGRLNAEQQRKTLDEVKRYELTVIFCARSNPITVDADGDKFLACVHRLYPGGPDLNGR